MTIEYVVIACDEVAIMEESEEAFTNPLLKDGNVIILRFMLGVVVLCYYRSKCVYTVCNVYRPLHYI